MENLQKNLSLAVGLVLTLVGVVGFFTQPLLLVFGINTLHNVIHLLSGVLGLAAAIALGSLYAPTFNKGVGIVYVLVAVLGFVLPTLMAGLLNLNLADNLLHLVLGILLVGVGFGVKD